MWLLFTVNDAETLNFAICGIQEVGVVVLSLACIFCLTRQDASLKYAGCLFLVLACATYANAFMLVPIGIVLLYRRERKVLAAWLACTAVILSIFLYRYQFLPHPHANPVRLVAFFLALLGSPFGVHGVYAFALLAGLLVLLLCVYLIQEKAWNVQPFAFWAAVWLLLGYALTSYGRGAGPMANALASRYKLYADVLLAAIYIQLLELWLQGRLQRIRPKVVVPVFTVSLVLFELFSDATGWYRLHLKHDYQRHGMHRYLESGGKVSPLWYSDPLEPWMVRPGVLEEARVMLSECTRVRLYRLPGRW